MAEMTEKDLLAEISRKLDRLIGIIAIQGKDVSTQIKILTDLGLPSTEIGPLLGIRPGSVRARRARG